MRPVTRVDSGDRLTGSMTPHPSDSRSQSAGVRLDQAGLDGVIRLVRTADGLAVEAELTSPHPVELVLTFDDQALGLGDVTAPAVAVPGPGRVAVRGAGSGEGFFRVALRQIRKNDDATVHFEVFDSGTSLQEGRLTLSGDGEPSERPDDGR